MAIKKSSVRVACTKTLNIITNGNLQWKEHVDSGSKNISKMIGMLRRVKPSVTQDSLNTMYKSLVLPNFDYCRLVFGNCNKSDKVKKLQNRPARLITGYMYEIRSNDVLTKFSLETIDQRREQQMIKVVNKSL